MKPTMTPAESTMQVDVLPDGSCVPAISDDALWTLASVLHSNVPEDKRPMSWSDYSPEQVQRLRDAAKAFIGKYRAALGATSQTPDAALQNILADQIEQAKNSIERDHLLGANVKFIVANLRSTPSASAGPQAEAWCQPMDNGKHKARKFMIYFEDPDHGIMVFTDEAEARAAFEKKNMAWNCYLFGTLPLYAHPQPQAEAVDGRGAVIEEIAAHFEQRKFGTERYLFPDEIAEEIRAALSQAPATDGRGAVIEECETIIANMRQSEAGLFDEKHSGQRGCDRADTLYDAYQALIALQQSDGRAK